tara:strand:+ start:150 stop:1793 length:1644 start_codon:yes stop_codon:yes gene_type:complete
MNNYKNYLKNNTKEIFIFLILLSLFAGLNTKWPSHNDLYSKIDTIPKIINLVRFLGLYFIPIIFYIYFYYHKNYQFNHNLVLLCLYMYFVAQLIGFANFYFFNSDLYQLKSISAWTTRNGYNIRPYYSFYISLALIIPIPLIAIILKKELLTNNAINFSVAILSLITLLYTSKVIYEFIITDKIYFYYIPFLSWGNFFDMPAPRSTGMGKWYLILYLFSMAKYVMGKKHNLAWFTIMTIMATFVYMFQSRTSIYFCAAAIFFLFLKKENFGKIILSILIAILFIFSFSTGLINLKKYQETQKFEKKLSKINSDKIELQLLLEQIEIEEQKAIIEQKTIIEQKPIEEQKVILKLKEIKKNKEIIINNLKKTQKILTTSTTIIANSQAMEANQGRHANRLKGIPENYSSGRRAIWEQLTSYSFSAGINNFLFGYGSQSDRYLVGQNASSGFFYVLITSGSIGLVFFLIILFYILYLFLNILRNYNFLKKNELLNHHHFFSTLILAYLFLRLIVENSFTMYGLDYLFFLICSANIFNLNFKLQNILDKNS